MEPLRVLEWVWTNDDARRMRVYRAENDITQEQLAKMMGVSVETVVRLEKAAGNRVIKSRVANAWRSLVNGT